MEQPTPPSTMTSIVGSPSMKAIVISCGMCDEDGHNKRRCEERNHLLRIENGFLYLTLYFCLLYCWTVLLFLNKDAGLAICLLSFQVHMNNQ